jgi:hypothetical protein
MAYSYVQGALGENGAANQQTIPVTLNAPVSSGDLICVGIGWANASNLVTVSDNVGNTYTVVDTAHDPAVGYTWASAYCLNAIGGATTVTGSVTSSVVFGSILVDEFSGTGSLNFDQHASNTQSNPGNATDAITSTAITTTYPGELVWSACVSVSSTGLTIGTNFTVANNIVAAVFLSEFLTQASAGSIAATFTTAASAGDYITNLLTFGSPPAPPVTIISIPDSGTMPITRLRRPGYVSYLDLLFDGLAISWL